MLDRRAFLTFSLGATAGMMLTPIPWKLTDDASIWTQNWKWNPKVPKRAIYFQEMASKLDPAGTGVKVALVNGIPVSVAGNEEHPLSQGGLSTMAAAEVSLLNSPSRVKGPMLKTADGFKSISWDEAENILAEKLALAGEDVAMISGDDTGTANEIFATLVKHVGGSFYMMPGEAQSAAKAMEMMGGTGSIAYDIDNADLVVFLGADALDSSGTAVRNARAFGVAHPHGQAATAKYVYAGPVRNSTAVVCDQWIQAKPGAAADVALGLAHILMENGATADAAGFAGFKNDVAANYSPARIERETGVRADALKTLARELAAAKRPLVIAGSEFGQGAGARAVMAGLSLNMLLGSPCVKNVAEAPTVVPGAPKASERYGKDLVPFVQQVASGKAAAKLLMIYDANPAYSLPGAGVMARAMEQAGFNVSFSSFMDETAELADLIMPNHMTIERYDDVYTPYGSQALYSVNTPLVKPVHDTKATTDVMLSLGDTVGANMGHGSFKDVLKAKARSLGASWMDVSKGRTWTSASSQNQRLNLAACAAKVVPASGNGTLALAPTAKNNLGNGKVAIPPYSTSTIRSDELDGAHSVARMNAKTARLSGVKAGEMITLSGPGGKMTAKVSISEDVMTGVVATMTGFGHTAWDDFSKGLGDNAFNVLAASDDPETGLSVWSHNRVKIATA